MKTGGFKRNGRDSKGKRTNKEISRHAERKKALPSIAQLCWQNNPNIEYSS